VNYLFHGPLGLQTRDVSWKPEFRAAANTALKTLKLLKKTDLEFDANDYIDDSFIRAAYKQAGLDYEAKLKNYSKSPLNAKDAKTGKAITDPLLVGQVWIVGEPKVRHYALLDNALEAAKATEAAGKKVRVVYAHDRNTGIKLFANQAWFVRDAKGALAAFLLKDDADAWAKAKGGAVLDFAAAKTTAGSGQLALSK
jgi:NitT/TauT family transport system substrate-binding protein